MAEPSSGSGDGAGAGEAPAVKKPSAAPARCAEWQKTSLMVAARHGQLEVIVRALETSCTQPQLDLVDEKGNTALMVAAKEGHDKVVDALIGAGADLAVVNLEGKTALDLAATEPIKVAIRAAEQRVEQLMKAIVSGAAPSSSSSSAGALGGIDRLAGLNSLGSRECPL
eukprot:gnl/TRDRNA2_/TRDRNA2_189110_c0_seq1.p1 gnl/TRDRNA2_/TRDRNA2_189110_c0~~gnl/TRDRNA2_/TRDRNA2_189110_c0_seq1.p1  ORF type:complete len:169 (+),score=33.36 gnl/TRDRNA2_/TRDRNA2_189110_c0_seq1:58-564(+)